MPFCSAAQRHRDFPPCSCSAQAGSPYRFWLLAAVVEVRRLVLFSFSLFSARCSRRQGLAASFRHLGVYFYGYLRWLVVILTVASDESYSPAWALLELTCRWYSVRTETARLLALCAVVISWNYLCSSCLGSVEACLWLVFLATKMKRGKWFAKF